MSAGAGRAAGQKAQISEMASTMSATCGRMASSSFGSYATWVSSAATRRTGVVLCGMYWLYVVWLWPVLYWLVYLY